MKGWKEVFGLGQEHRNKVATRGRGRLRGVGMNSVKELDAAGLHK